MTTITCTTCGGTGNLNSATCTTCSGSGVLTVDIADISPDSVTGDSNVDIDTSDKSAFLFVPKNDGSNDKTTPGVLFRLGSYCDIETAADTQAKDEVLYPEQFVANADDSTKAYEDAAGSDTSKGGILLSCDGQILVKSCEKTFLRSDDEIKIESGKKIVIRSGRDDDEDSRDITLNSNNGDINMKAATSTKEFLWHDITLTEGDSVGYTKGDTVGITEGTKTYVTLGSEHFMCFGNQVAVTVGGVSSFTLGIGLSVSISFKFKIANVDIAFRIKKFEVSKFVFEKKEVSVEDKLLNLRKEMLEIKDGQTVLNKDMLSLSDERFKFLKSEIDLNKKKIGINTTQMNANRAALLHLYL